MNLSDRIQLIKCNVTQDAQLNPIEVKTLVELGKCAIVKNSSAATIKGNDGNAYNYSYVVYMRKPKDVMMIPCKDDIVHISKKDGTIDSEHRVVDFVTLKNWLKIWL